MKSSGRERSETKPLFPPEVGPILGHERELMQDYLLPIERSRIGGLTSLVSRGMGGVLPESVAGPLEGIGRQAMATVGGMMGDLPSWVAAPIEERVATAARQLPEMMRRLAPEDLEAFSKNLIGPAFAQLFAPGTQSTSTGAGPTTFQQALGTAGTLASIASTVAMVL